MSMKTFVSPILMAMVLFSEACRGNDEHATMDHSEMGHSHGVHTQNNAPKATIKLSVVKIEDKGDKKVVQIKLTKIQDDSLVVMDNLKKVHTEKIHLLIIDDGLEDYTHVHPKPTADKGIYEFEWRPTKRDATYRMWVDLFPLDTGVQEYAMADLTTRKDSKSEINKAMSLTSTVDGLTFKLSFDSADLQVGKPAMGKIDIIDDKGNPVDFLEPIMGSFAHIVGFGEDFKSVVHVHPMGEEPTKGTQRGGPVLQFHLQPEAAGFIKLFAQTKVKGKELFAPFGVVVKDAR